MRRTTRPSIARGCYADIVGVGDKLSDFILVLDGDSRGLDAQLQAIAAQCGHAVHLLFLPGDGPPETWLWRVLHKRPDEYAARLGLSPADFRKSMGDVERLSEGRAAAQRGQGRCRRLGRPARRSVPEVARIIGRREAERNAIPGMGGVRAGGETDAATLQGVLLMALPIGCEITFRPVVRLPQQSGGQWPAKLAARRHWG